MDETNPTSKQGILGLKQSVVDAVNELYEQDLITPTGGNISIRCPDRGTYLITANQIFKGDLSPEHILEVDDKGKPVIPPEGAAAVKSGPNASSGGRRRIRPSVETGMHLGIYAGRPDIGAVIHTHAPLATVWGLFSEPVPPVTLEAIRFMEMQTVPFAAPGSRDLATRATQALTRGPAALLQNHGLITVGKDLREAINVALALEETLKITFMARMMGLVTGFNRTEPAAIPPKAVEFLKKIMIG